MFEHGLVFVDGQNGQGSIILLSAQASQCGEVVILLYTTVLCSIHLEVLVEILHMMALFSLPCRLRPF